MILVLTLAAVAAFGLSLDEQLDEQLRARIEAAGTPPRIEVGSELIHACRVLPMFYERRGFRPAWSGDNGPGPRAEAMAAAIRGATDDGLNPADYHLDRIEQVLGEVRANREAGKPLHSGRLVDLDLLLTDSFLVYGAHLLSGRLDPETVDPQWNASRREGDLGAVLEQALVGTGVAAALESLRPVHPGYGFMRQALARYRGVAAAGGWSAVPGGEKLESGAVGQRVRLLTARLAASGDLDAAAAERDLFDDDLDAAVRRFQRRHGLAADGVVGPKTIEALNIPVEHRIEQLVNNMERWRWLPLDLGRRHILVNIANFELDVVEDNRSVLNMRAIVGRPFRRTPVFSATMTYLVFSPSWNVPHKLAVEDKLPEIRKDPAYFGKMGIRVLQGWGADAREIDPAAVDWSSVNRKNFPYRLRQEPGPLNALGRVKFMFPNKFDVYIHDTPSRELFSQPQRDFSSGCIRTEKPLELALYLLAEDSAWDQGRIAAAAASTSEQTVTLPRPIPVHLLYWTAWAEENGEIHFRRDIYDRDGALNEALAEPPPSSACATPGAVP